MVVRKQSTFVRGRSDGKDQIITRERERAITPPINHTEMRMTMTNNIVLLLFYYSVAISFFIRSSSNLRSLLLLLLPESSMIGAVG